MSAYNAPERPRTIASKIRSSLSSISTSSPLDSSTIGLRDSTRWCSHGFLTQGGYIFRSSGVGDVDCDCDHFPTACSTCSSYDGMGSLTAFDTGQFPSPVLAEPSDVTWTDHRFWFGGKVESAISSFRSQLQLIERDCPRPSGFILPGPFGVLFRSITPFLFRKPIRRLSNKYLPLPCLLSQQQRSPDGDSGSQNTVDNPDQTTGSTDGAVLVCRPGYSGGICSIGTCDNHHNHLHHLRDAYDSPNLFHFPPVLVTRSGCRALYLLFLPLFLLPTFSIAAPFDDNPSSGLFYLAHVYPTVEGPVLERRANYRVLPLSFIFISFFLVFCAIVLVGICITVYRSSRLDYPFWYPWKYIDRWGCKTASNTLESGIPPPPQNPALDMSSKRSEISETETISDREVDGSDHYIVIVHPSPDSAQLSLARHNSNKSNETNYFSRTLKRLSSSTNHHILLRQQKDKPVQKLETLSSYPQTEVTGSVQSHGYGDDGVNDFHHDYYFSTPPRIVIVPPSPTPSAVSSTVDRDRMRGTITSDFEDIRLDA